MTPVIEFYLCCGVQDNGLNLLGVSSYPQLVIKAAVVIVAVLISKNRRRTLLVK
jgi:predicted ABC-type sugar transport system permease subunit